MQSPLTELIHKISVNQLSKIHSVMYSEPIKQQQAQQLPSSSQLLSKIYSTINAKYNQKQFNLYKCSISLSADQPTSHNVSTIKCNCKKSQCLKLYCQCFSQGMRCGYLGSVCNGCGCICCQNKQQFSQMRAKAIDEMIIRGPLGFGRKNSSVKGCNCKKTGCLKKYCECYGKGQKCNQYCKCNNCQNLQ